MNSLDVELACLDNSVSELYEGDDAGADRYHLSHLRRNELSIKNLGLEMLLFPEFLPSVSDSQQEKDDCNVDDIVEVGSA
jgi:hypothetical protein